VLGGLQTQLPSDERDTPQGRVDLISGSRVQLELKQTQQPRPQADLSNVEAMYTRIDKEYPDANVRAVYRDRAELHDR
jgi:hypothetical protein